jgi:hypothetical protein
MLLYIYFMLVYIKIIKGSLLYDKLIVTVFV